MVADLGVAMRQMSNRPLPSRLGQRAERTPRAVHGEGHSWAAHGCFIEDLKSMSISEPIRACNPDNRASGAMVEACPPQKNLRTSWLRLWSRSSVRPFGCKERIVRLCAAAGPIFLVGCHAVTVFESDFNKSLLGTPPATAQEVGTIATDGTPGSVQVVDSPAWPSGHWVSISRGEGPTLSALQCNFSEFKGQGTYTLSCLLFIPSGAGVATIQFEEFRQHISQYKSFLHLDFTAENRVRIDDEPATAFGAFPRDVPFLLTVVLEIRPDGATAHIALAGSTANGTATYEIKPAPARPSLFGAVRFWMGYPHTGTFKATQVMVRYAADA